MTFSDKRFLAFALAFTLVFILVAHMCMMSFAEDTFPTETDPWPSDPEGSTTIIVTSPDTSDMKLTKTEVISTRITANEATGLKRILLQLFGDYELITKEYTYSGSNGYTSKQVTTESDYPWMISAAIFAIVLYSVFRMIGGIFANGKRY